MLVIAVLLTTGLLAGCLGKGHPSAGGAAAPGERSPLVGTWILEGEFDFWNPAFLPDFELRGDGTVRLVHPGIHLGGEGGLATWKADGGRLTISVVEAHEEGETPDTATVTYDYTLSDATLTLKNARAVLVENGKERHETNDGSATYKKSAPAQSGTDNQTAPGQAQPERPPLPADAQALIGTWIIEKKNDDFPPDFELLADGTMDMSLMDDFEDDELLMTWTTAGGGLIFSVVVQEHGETFTGTTTFDYTLSDSTLTLSNGRVVATVKGETTNLTLNGQATYKKRDAEPAPAATPAKEENAIEEDKPAPTETTDEPAPAANDQAGETPHEPPAAVPNDPRLLVGAWTVEEEEGEGEGENHYDYPPDFELLADGTMSLDEDDGIADRRSLTWKVEDGRLVIEMTVRDDEGGIAYEATITYEYTLLDSTLTLFNGHRIVTRDGEVTDDDTAEGEATYKKRAPDPTTAPAAATDPADETPAENHVAVPNDPRLLVGAWTVEQRDNGVELPPDFELHADGTMSLDEDDEIADRRSLTWKVDDGRLVIEALLRDSEGNVTDEATLTYDYTLLDSTLTLSNGKTVTIDDGEVEEDIHAPGEATYKKRAADPAPTTAPAENDSAGETPADNPAAIPNDPRLLVGAWVLKEQTSDDGHFPPDFELLADGTVNMSMADEELGEGETGRLTWKVEDGRLIVTFVIHDSDGGLVAEITLTSDYTLVDSALTLSNFRVVVTEDGEEVEDDTAEGEATYEKRAPDPAPAADPVKETGQAGETPADNPIAIPNDPRFLVGAWVLKEQPDNDEFVARFPSSFELLADGTMNIDDEWMEGQTFSLTWNVDNGRLVFSFVGHEDDGDGEFEVKITVTSDYTVLDSTLALSNTRAVVVEDGEVVEDDTVKSEVTYTKRETGPTREDDEDAEDDDDE